MGAYQHALGIRKIMFGWLKDKERSGTFFRNGMEYKVAYYITGIKVSLGVWWPEIILEIRVSSYSIKHKSRTEWLLRTTKPGSSILRGVNTAMRGYVLRDISSELNMFDIHKSAYIIKVSTIKWDIC
jgi:hypothetical protein